MIFERSLREQLSPKFVFERLIPLFRREKSLYQILGMNPIKNFFIKLDFKATGSDTMMHEGFHGAYAFSPLIDDTRIQESEVVTYLSALDYELFTELRMLEVPGDHLIEYIFELVSREKQSQSLSQELSMKIA